MAQILAKNKFLQRSSICLIRHFSSVDAQKPHYDIIIAGGGLVGVSLAVSLGKCSCQSGNFFCYCEIFFSAKNQTLADKKVLLLESAPAFKEFSKEKYSNRVSAINRQTIGLLKKLDAWEHIESVRCKKILQMQVRYASASQCKVVNQTFL